MDVDALDTTGLRPLYRLRTAPWSRRLLIGALGATAGSTAARLVQEPPAAADGVLAVALLLACLAGLVLQWRCPPAIALTPQGVRIRDSFAFGPLVPWGEVVEVRAPGRWDEHASIRLPHRGNLRRTTLAGMPAQDAATLAAAFRRFRATTPG